MANRFPLIVDSSGTAAIKELASGDNLDLTGNGIVGAGTVALTNLTVGGSQGTDGQVLTSTGSGVAWEDAASGGGGGAWNVISSQTVSSNVASVEMSLSGYANYAIVFTDPRHTTSLPQSVPQARWYFSTNNGSSWSSNIAYVESRNVSWTGNEIQLGSSGSQSYLGLTDVHSQSNSNFSSTNSNFPINGILYLYNNISGSTHKAGAFDTSKVTEYGFFHSQGGFSVAETNPINKIKFDIGGVTQIGNGTFTLYGLSTS